MLRMFVPIASLVLATGICPAAEPIAVSLQETRPYEYFGRLHLGSVEDGEGGTVDFRLVNTSGRRIVLSPPTGTCGCIQVEISSSVIEPGKSVDGKLSVDVKANRQPVWRQRLFFDGNKAGDASVELEVVSEISSLLAFQDTQFIIQVFKPTELETRARSRPIEMQLPFYATPPIKIADVELSVAPELAGMKAAVVGREERVGEVRLSLDASNTDLSVTALTVRLRDTNTGAVATIRGAIAYRSEISIVPSTVRLRRSQDDKIIGNVVIARLLSKEHRSEKESSEPFAKAYLKGTSLDVRMQRVSEVVCRASVVVPESLLDELVEEDSDNTIKWDVMWGPSRVTSESKIYIDAPISSEP